MAQPGAKPAGKMDLSDMTKLSADVSKRDLEELIAETVDTDKSDYCVVTGIHVHNWAPQVRARAAAPSRLRDARVRTQVVDARARALTRERPHTRARAPRDDARSRPTQRRALAPHATTRALARAVRRRRAQPRVRCADGVLLGRPRLPRGPPHLLIALHCGSIRRAARARTRARARARA